MVQTGWVEGLRAVLMTQRDLRRLHASQGRSGLTRVGEAESAVAFAFTFAFAWKPRPEADKERSMALIGWSGLCILTGIVAIRQQTSRSGWKK